MDDNPYAAPVSTARESVVGVLSGRREDLRKVAFAQKGIMVCILLYLMLVFGQFIIPLEFRRLIIAAALCLGVAGLVFVFMLATRVYGTGEGIAMACLTIIPCLGLIILLIVNQKATNILKQNGIEVGLLGAKGKI